LREQSARGTRELRSDYTATKECVVTVGGKHSIFNAISVLIQNGDEVILHAHYWVSFQDIIKYAGGTPVIVQTRPETGFGAKSGRYREGITPKNENGNRNSPQHPWGLGWNGPAFEKSLRVWQESNICGDGRRVRLALSIRPAQAVFHRQREQTQTTKTSSSSGEYRKHLRYRFGASAITLAPKNFIQAMTQGAKDNSTRHDFDRASTVPSKQCAARMGHRSAELAEYGKREAIVEGLARIRVTYARPVASFYACRIVQRTWGRAKNAAGKTERAFKGACSRQARGPGCGKSSRARILAFAYALRSRQRGKAPASGKKFFSRAEAGFLNSDAMPSRVLEPCFQPEDLGSGVRSPVGSGKS